MKARVLCFCGAKVTAHEGACETVCKCGWQWRLVGGAPSARLPLQPIVEPFDWRYCSNSGATE